MPSGQMATDPAAIPSHHSLFLFYGDIVGMATILLITPPLHMVVNILGYRMNKKDVPW